MWYQYSYLLVLSGCCVYALALGGAPERLAALAMLIGSLASVLVIRASFEHVEVGLLAVDLVDELVLIAIMLEADRFWPILAVALHTLELLVPAAKQMVPAIHPWAYAATEQAIAYLVLLLIAIGVYRHRVRLRRFANDPPWTSFFG